MPILTVLGSQQEEVIWGPNSSTGALRTPLWKAAAVSMSHFTACTWKQALTAKEVNAGSESSIPSAWISTLQLTVQLCTQHLCALDNRTILRHGHRGIVSLKGDEAPTVRHLHSK